MKDRLFQIIMIGGVLGSIGLLISLIVHIASGGHIPKNSFIVVIPILTSIIIQYIVYGHYNPMFLFKKEEN